jgi:ferredoxin
LKLKLTYTHENVNKPVLSEIVLKTKTPMNILEAKVTASAGELIVDTPATGDKLKEIISLFQDAGVKVAEITAILEINREICIFCGACVSPCPVQAIKQKADWDIEFDEAKCVRCGICVDACPVRAIKLI